MNIIRLIIIGLFFNVNLKGENIPPINLEIEEAGTLSNLISESRKYQITDLTLKGDLNGSDIRFIRDMVQRGTLMILDISDTNIVEGGEGYYYSHPSYYRTSRNTLGMYMFSECINLSHIILPNSIEYIQYGAFQNCKSLKTIVIPDNVYSVSICAFEGCSELETAIIGNNVSEINKLAFIRCPKIKEINVTDENSYFSSIDGIVFSKDKESLVMYPNNKSHYYEIPDNIIIIEHGAFYECENISSIIIGKHVETIGGNAFEYCTSLSSLNIPDNVIDIQGAAFRKCNSLISIKLGEELKSIGGNCFEECSLLENVEIPDKVITIGSRAFYKCNSLKSVIIGDNVESIGESCFEKCTEIISVKLGNSLQVIGSMAFYGCTNLSSVIIPSRVNSIGSLAFDCPNLKEIYSRSIMPPIVESNTFTSVDKEKCNLYVPENSYGQYWIAKGWENFENIIKVPKEDIFYKISFTSNEGGIVLINDKQVNSIIVEEGTSSYIHILPSSNYKLSLITLNGENVLNEIQETNSYYIDYIEEDFYFDIKFEEENITDISFSTIQNYGVKVHQNLLNIQVEYPTYTSIYNLSGQEVYSRTVVDETTIRLESGLYIVKVGNEVQKVVVN